MCKKCTNLEQLDHAIRKAIKELPLKPDASLTDRMIDHLSGSSDYWYERYEEYHNKYLEQLREEGNNITGDNLHSDMGFIVGKESPEPSPKETHKPKRKKRIGTKTEMQKFRALLDNPETAWKEIMGQEGGAQ